MFMLQIFFMSNINIYTHNYIYTLHTGLFSPVLFSPFFSYFFFKGHVITNIKEHQGLEV